MDHKTAIDRGFDFKYTILTDKDYFNVVKKTDKDGRETYAKIGVAKKDINSCGKVANVLVELQADGLTVAYGFISAIITNDKQEVTIELPELVLQCPEDFKQGIKWTDFIDAIKAKVGDSFDIDKYNGYAAGYVFNKLNKDFETLTGDIAASQVKKDGANFVWSFTEATAEKVFYTKNSDGTLKAKDSEPYYVYLKLTPKDPVTNPDLADIEITVILKGVVYPTGKFYRSLNGIQYRIQRYWFKQYTDDLATSAEEMDEVHANVEVVDQTDADDEFKFDVTSWFYGNKFTFVPDDPFDFSAAPCENQGILFFNPDMYYVYDVADDGLEWDKLNAPETSFITGASGTKYLLYVNKYYGDVLRAVKGGKLLDTQAQDVVTLAGERNKDVTYHGLLSDPAEVNNDYARDLLNRNAHYELGKDQTFTTHMILADDGSLSCLPIVLKGDNTFDIRYLRPLSAITSIPGYIEDARDGGTDETRVYLADLINYQDWRKVDFTAKKGTKYLNYYGVKTVTADFKQAKTNLAGEPNVAITNITDSEGNLIRIDSNELTDADKAAAAAWPKLSDVTSKLQFKPSLFADAEKAEGETATEYNPETENVEDVTKTYTKRENLKTRTYKTFKKECGYYLYENNSGNVGTFQIYLPVSITYDWGQTKDEWVLITIARTKGQIITARQK